MEIKEMVHGDLSRLFLNIFGSFVFYFSSAVYARVDDSSTEAGALCIDEALCASGGSSLSRFAETLPENNSCPKFIIKQQALQDSKSSLTTDSPDEICLKQKDAFQSHFKSALELESYLQKNPHFSKLNETSSHPYFSSCLSQRVSTPMSLGKTSLSSSLRVLPDHKKKLAIAEYYSSLRRLSDGIERSIQNITAIDTMIEPDSLLQDVSCKDLSPISKSMKNQCQSLKQCSNNKDPKHSPNNAILDQSAKDTLLALQGIDSPVQARGSYRYSFIRS